MQREIKRFAVLMVAAIIIAPLALLVWSLTGERTPEDVFGGEGNFISWLSSSQMIVIGVVAYLNAAAIWRARRESKPSAALSSRSSWSCSWHWPCAGIN